MTIPNQVTPHPLPCGCVERPYIGWHAKLGTPVSSLDLNPDCVIHTELDRIRFGDEDRRDD